MSPQQRLLKTRTESFYTHKARWDTCTICSIGCVHTTRIYMRGPLNPDVLIIGEAPGDAEVALEEPFVGPAGQFFDKLIITIFGPQTKYGHLKLTFTNAIICPPGDTLYSKLRTPKKEEIINCNERLCEFVKITRPTSIVLAGKIAEQAWKMIPNKDIHLPWNWHAFTIPHPSHVANLAERGGAERARLLQGLRDAAQFAVDGL